MKTKQVKEETDKIIDEEITKEPKTRARKKAEIANEEDKGKASHDEPKTSKDKRNITKPKAVVKKRPLGIRKALRNKKVVIKDKLKHVIKQTGKKRGRKPAVKVEPDNSQEKDTDPLIPASEIKKEPLEETTSSSRSSSPKTAGRRQRLSSDMIMMKSMLGESPSSFVLGPRTSPYSMRSERSNSPSIPLDSKNLRSGKRRKVKNNLLNEVVMKEQKKRRRLLSDSKANESTESPEDCKKLKRGRSCSRDGSEISKCSDVTESDASLSETTLNDTDGKELTKKIDKPKTELDLDIENNLQISTFAKVPSLNVDSKQSLETSIIIEKNKKKLSLKRSTSLDSDNNNSNRIKLDSDIKDKLVKTENDTLLDARSSILTSMSKTFNSKEMSKNMRKARRGRKAAATVRPASSQSNKNCTNSTITTDMSEDKMETIDTLAKEINDLINDLDQNIDKDNETGNNSNVAENVFDQSQTKQVNKLHSLSKPLGDNNIIVAPETPIRNKEVSPQLINEVTPSKDDDDSENIRLHYEDSAEKSSDGMKQDITYKCTTVASIDKLMDRLKEFEEFDKRRQRQESESKLNDPISVMMTNDVVLIPKSGDIKPLKDIQTARSPERPIEKENVLSCFENNSAISIVKREQVRKSIDIDLPNSVTLIKRNSLNTRKESTSSNHSRESDAISIFEKSLGKDVTLTEIRKSVDKLTPAPQVDLHQLATLHPNNPTQSLVGMVIDSSQISITPCVIEAKIFSNDLQLTKRKSTEANFWKHSESVIETDEKMATIEIIKSPSYHMKSPAISITPAPVAIKSPEVQPMETEALAPPLENVKAIPDDIPLASEVPNIESTITEVTSEVPNVESTSTEVTSEASIIEKKTFEITCEVPKIGSKSFEVTSDVPNIESTTPEVTSEVPNVESKTVEVTPEAPNVESITPEVTSQVPNIESTTTEVKSEVLNIESLAIEATVAETLLDDIVDTKLITIHQTEVAIMEIDDKTDLEVKQELKLPQVEIMKVIPEEIQKPIEETESKPEVDTKAGKSQRRSSSKSARNSVENQPGPSNMLFETPESQKRKESILRTLGLLTHKEAKETEIEKQKEKERIYSNLSKKSGKSNSGDYTGTLKTVIKLNRNAGERERKKYRSSLKYTFQKSKNRGKPAQEVGEAEGEDYYTIERREGGATSADGGHRKSHYSNRLNSHETEAVPEPEEPSKDTEILVIPEKASSFGIHPGRLCRDQCCYCGGKFGLFDTPCHIASIKSTERQKKVLANEEKLTVDSCLCDACYRHVDRRANCPSYRKRIVKPDATDKPVQLPSIADNSQPEVSGTSPVSCEEEGGEGESRVEGVVRGAAEMMGDAGGVRRGVCHVSACAAPADRAIRRKWLIKVRSSVNKLLKLEYDYPGMHTIPLCGEHYRALAPLMACALCRRAVTKHHNVHVINQGYQDLNPLLCAAQVPVQFVERPVLCKPCRNYCAALHKLGLQDQHNQLYTRKLLRIHNIQVSDELENTTEELISNRSTSPDESSGSKQKKKARSKSKQRKSTEPEKSGDSESHDRNESPENKADTHMITTEESTESEQKANQPLEEDIESLISTNKILVPSAPKPVGAVFLSPVAFLDTPTELKYLLQKQNNPAQYMPKTTNLTQKPKKVPKLQTAIQKPGLQHRIEDKNARRLHKLGQMITENDRKEDNDIDMSDTDKVKDSSGSNVLKNIPLNDECTIETIPNKKPADINTLKNKWQMSESFTQVKKNLNELFKNPGAKKQTDAKYSNPVKRLETNPSISVRELFPGEEEMNLQCNVEFNNVQGVTPAGWEKCNTTIQYDSETKRLWTELQRPYGNQSSFLRHLILLEKYFRTGDLVLSPNASPHAANYSDSVQSRLRAYDNVVNDTPRRSEPMISLIEYRKKPSVNGKSLLKTNHNSEEKEKKSMPPPGTFPKPKPMKSDKTKAKPLPPELIAINTPNAQGRKSIQNVLHNIQQLVKGVSASDPTEVASAPLPPPPKYEPPKEKKETPKIDTPKKKKPTSKPWRPTLMPINAENVAKIRREPHQVAVDGRLLPCLVKVMSSNEPYYITRDDYNKMCVMRREKLQQLQEGEAKTKLLEPETVVTEIQPSAILGNGGTVLQNVPNDKDTEKSYENQIGSNAATILKNVGLKNITIAPIAQKTATVTSHTITSSTVTSPSILVTSTAMKMPQLTAVSITSETVLTPNLTSSTMIMPKIPKSLTVIPQMVAMSQSMVMTPLPPPVVTDGQRP